MGASMNSEEAKKIAEKMTYSEAVSNALCGKCVPYRKATKIKLKELLVIAKKLDGEAERPNGHWIITDEDLIECSNCHEKYWYEREQKKWNCCPECGSDNRGEE